MINGKDTQDTAWSGSFNQVHGQLNKCESKNNPVPSRTHQNSSSLQSLVRCRRWDPFLDLLSCGGVRNILLWSASHVELVVCPDEFTGCRRFYRWRVVGHAVEPTVPGRGKTPVMVYVKQQHSTQKPHRQARSRACWPPSSLSLIKFKAPSFSGSTVILHITNQENDAVGSRHSIAYNEGPDCGCDNVTLESILDSGGMGVYGLILGI